MSTFTSIPQPTLNPPIHRGLEVLDRDLFSVELPLLAAVVPAKDTTEIARILKNYLLRLPKFGHVVSDPSSSEHRLVLLRMPDSATISPELREELSSRKIEFTQHQLKVNYDHWTSDEILQSILPENLLHESPTSFTQVGHIAHLNLRDEYLPHRHLIGQVILDKNKSLRTVVNKLDTIDNTFRNFAMEVLAGDPDFIVTTSESNCRFTFDFSLVYWNSRLQTEHARLVDSFSPSDVVVDAFAGVGPFAVPAGKKGCAVLASDLNPASASALAENTKANKVEANVRTANEDARDFIRSSVLDVWSNPFPSYSPPLSQTARSKLARKAASTPKEASTDPPPPPPPAGPPRKVVNHFVMNLPNSAIEFLDAFRGLYKPLYELEGAREEVQKVGHPMVHCYCFTKEDGDEAEKDILARANHYLGMEVKKDDKDYKLRFVRDVAPKKSMYCLEFRLTEEMVV